MTLPTAGVLRYNGYSFGPYTETTGVTVRPRYDAAGRTVAANVFAFRFRTVLTAPAGGSGSTAAEALLARRALSKPAGEFEYRGRGFCEMHVNRPGGGVRDVAWGPRPQEMSFTPAGRDQACVLEWALETTVPDCADAVYEFQALEFNFAVTYAKTDDGRATRQTAGHLVVPATRLAAGDRTLPDAADRYRERVVARLPRGFTRKFGAFRLDAAKTRLDFEYTDTAFGRNVPPPGVIEAHADHHFHSSAAGLQRWTATLNAEYLLEDGEPFATAVRAFFGLVKDRTEALKKGLEQDPAWRGKLDKPGQAIVPLHAAVREPEVYGANRVGFVLAYAFPGSLGTMLAAGGLWRPAPDANGAWARWEASLRAGYLHPRGKAGLAFGPEDDRLVDLCEPDPDPGPGFAAELVGGVLPVPAEKAEVFTEMVAKAFPAPAKDASYLLYECQIELENDAGVVLARPLPGAALAAESDLFGPRPDGLGGPAPAAPAGPAVGPNGLAGGPLEATFPPAAVAQRRVRPLVYLYLVGRAARAGYPVDVPRLTDVDGVPATPANRLDRGEGFTQAAGFLAGQVVIHAARWRLRYALPQTPKSIPTPANPLTPTPTPR